MPTGACDRRTRHSARTATTVVAASVTLLVGCTSPPAPPARPGAGSATVSSARPVTAAPSSPRGRSPTGMSSPVHVAEQWLATYRSTSWTDGTPTGWIERVRPYVTAALNAWDEQYADAAGGADWQAFVANQCTSVVTDLGAVIPPESPGTVTAINVQVTGTVHTACDAGQPESPTDTAAATLVVIEAPDGSWRVNQRLH